MTYNDFRGSLYIPIWYIYLMRLILNSSTPIFIIISKLVGVDFRVLLVNLFWFCKSKDIPKLMISQMLLETGRFRSEVCQQNKNLFGMRKANTRRRVQKGENLGHATYNTYADSIIDYALWWNSIVHPLDKSQPISIMVVVDTKDTLENNVWLFNTALKNVGYYTANTNDYLSNLQYYARQLKDYRYLAITSYLLTMGTISYIICKLLKK